MLILEPCLNHILRPDTWSSGTFLIGLPLHLSLLEKLCDKMQELYLFYVDCPMNVVTKYGTNVNGLSSHDAINNSDDFLIHLVEMKVMGEVLLNDLLPNS